MPFKKGKVTNHKGRPAGVSNKVTTRTREAIEKIVSDQLPQIINDFQVLDPHDRINCFLKMLSFILPRLSTVEVKEDPAAMDEKVIDSRIKELLKIGGLK